MVIKSFDLEKHHPLLPRKEILDEYKKVNFDYEKSINDRVYEQWYAMVKGRAVTQEVLSIYRKKIAGIGEFLVYFVHLVGHDWKDNERDFTIRLGKYEKPIFRLEKDPQTQEITSTQISDHKTIYDVPYSQEKLQELLDMSIETVGLIVYGPASRRYGVQSVDDYQKGAIEDLVVSANKGKTLETVLAEKNQFTYEKRETKPAGKGQSSQTQEDSTGLKDAKSKTRE